jgi:hypothetical protein
MPKCKRLVPLTNYMDETTFKNKNVQNITVLKIHTVEENLGEYLDPKS